VRLTASHLLGLLLLAGACTGETGATEPVATATHALLRVDRSARVGAESEATGVAFAGVVRVPVLADPELLLRLSGKGPTLPAPGQCASASHERDAMPTGDLGRAEFLDAGDVLLGWTTDDRNGAQRLTNTPIYAEPGRTGLVLTGARGGQLRRNNFRRL
jgi:hypothetical protein